MQQANKQAIHCISTPNSPGQKRGGEKEFVIDHKKTKKKKREKKTKKEESRSCKRTSDV